MAVLPALPAHGGPWTKEFGQFYVKLSEGFFVSDSFVNSEGVTQSGASYLGASTSLYFEVGVFTGLQVQGFVPYVISRNTFDDGISALRVGPGDLTAGLQYTPSLALPLPAAVRLDIKVPLYDVGSTSSAFASRFPALGDGQIDMTLWLTAGGTLPIATVFAWAEIGYRFRTEKFVGDGPYG